MRRIACILILAAALYGAEQPALEVVQPTISQSDGGTPMPPGFEHAPGETLFFTFQVGGYARGPEDKVQVSYTVNAFDPAGVPFDQTVTNTVKAELTPHDKEWKPKIRMEVQLPPLAGSGTYKLVVKVTDDIAKKSAEKTVQFAVAGHEVEPSQTLVIRNFRYFRGEDDTEALAKPIYRPGDPVWARFDIIGYKFGAKNAVDVTYGIAILAPSGKVLWSQNDAATEKSESFYPKRYVPGSMAINLEKSIKPAEYTIAVQVRDAVGNQTYEGKYPFTVE